METLPPTPILKIFTETNPTQQELHSLYILGQPNCLLLGFPGRLGRRDLRTVNLSFRRKRSVSLLINKPVSRAGTVQQSPVAFQMRSAVTMTPPLITCVTSLNVPLRLLLGWAKVRSDDQPNDAKQRTLRRSFTRRFLCVYRSFRPNRRASPSLVDCGDRHTSPGNRNLPNSAPLPHVAAIICKTSDSVFVFLSRQD